MPLLVFRDRATGQESHLEGPYDSNSVLRGDARGCRRVQSPKNRVKMRLAQPICENRKPASQRLVPRRSIEEAVKERLEVEAGPPNDDGVPAPLGGFRDSPLRQTDPRGRRELLVGVHNVDEVMGHPRSLFEGGLRAANVEAAVDLEAVARNDLAAQSFR